MNYFAISGNINNQIAEFSKEHNVTALYNIDNNDVHTMIPTHISMLNRYKTAFCREYQFSKMINYINYDNLIVCCDTETVDSDLLFYFYWNHIFNKKILPNEIVFQKIVINPGIGARLTNYDFSLFGCRIPMFLKLTSMGDQHLFYRKFHASNKNIEDFDKFDNPMFDNFFIHQYLLKISTQVTANEKY
jgi:hypothetical protein